MRYSNPVQEHQIGLDPLAAKQAGEEVVVLVGGFNNGADTVS